MKRKMKKRIIKELGLTTSFNALSNEEQMIELDKRSNVALVNKDYKTLSFLIDEITKRQSTPREYKKMKAEYAKLNKYIKKHQDCFREQMLAFINTIKN